MEGEPVPPCQPLPGPGRGTGVPSCCSLPADWALSLLPPRVLGSLPRRLVGVPPGPRP